MIVKVVFLVVIGGSFTAALVCLADWWRLGGRERKRQEDRTTHRLILGDKRFFEVYGDE